MKYEVRSKTYVKDEMVHLSVQDEKTHIVATCMDEEDAWLIADLLWKNFTDRLEVPVESLTEQEVSCRPFVVANWSIRG